MEQLTLGILEKSKVKILASSAFDFNIELVEHIGKDDIPQLMEVSENLVLKFGKRSRLSKININKYFNKHTLPFVARHKGKIIGYIIGVPLEHFKNESWSHFDLNIGKNNTLYTYAFVLKENHRHRGGYAKTLKRIYINWAKKKGYEFVTGHVEQGISQRFSRDTEVIKVFPKWYEAKVPFEYYRRPLNPFRRG
jgi:hypothetical protein